MKRMMVIAAFLLLFTTNVHASQNSSQLLIINKSTNKMAYFGNGELIRVFDVATGRNPSYTPEGVFTIVNKIVDRPYYTLGIPGGDPANPLGPRWFGLDARGTYGTTYGIHGNSNPSSIGTYASAGCIRMNNDEVIWLFERVELYSTVIIVSSDKDFQQLALDYDYPLVMNVMGEEIETQLASDWALVAIENITQNGLADERILSNYRRNITRAEFASLIIDLYERVNENALDIENSQPFIDINDSVYKEDILKARQIGLMTGVSENKFNPNGQITREEIAVITHRFMEKVGFDQRNSSVITFEDASQASNWAMDSIIFVKKYEMMSGVTETLFGPKQIVPREQAITIVYRLALMKGVI